MRFFPLLDLQHMVLAVFFGLGLVILVCLAWLGYRDRGPEGADGQIPGERVGAAVGEGETVGGEKGEEHHDNPVSPLLIVLYAGVVIWMVGYVIVIGIRGGPIW